MANQRAPESVAEDGINKPRRPLVTGSISSEGLRRTMLVSVPLVLAINHWLGVGQQALALHVAMWLYNDLKGMDEFLLRDVVVTVGFALHNAGSLRLALGDEARINSTGMLWLGSQRPGGRPAAWAEDHTVGAGREAITGIHRILPLFLEPGLCPYLGPYTTVQPCAIAVLLALGLEGMDEAGEERGS
ncbi:hypothetical protein XA68_15230 [Ophiocordyceps unilateralis]|uniref:Uncharacterized protein n=1 Tax=Ophiocordyceps unilateralis TaxID=268505 RepID=A0A2A9P8Q6_OPHUN|nr:hypothetical protein XA68_15230 [Ophiocordyceps unilateralis]